MNGQMAVWIKKKLVFVNVIYQKELLCSSQLTAAHTINYNSRRDTEPTVTTLLWEVVMSSHLIPC